MSGTICIGTISCADPEGGRAPYHPPPMKNQKNIGLISRTGPGVPSQHP